MQIYTYKQITDNFELLRPLVTAFDAYYARIADRTPRGEAFGIQFTDAIVDRITNQDGVIIGAFDGEELKGFSAGVIEHMSEYEKIGYGEEHVYGIITDLFVSPEVERHGIGSELLYQVEKVLKENGATRFSLEVIQKNEQTLNFYKKNGYEIDSYILSK